MAYKKPQDPLTNNGFGIYPLTTADQVILSDGSRLEKNVQISIGGGTVKTVSGVAPDSAGNVALTASDVGAATAEEVSALKDDKLDKTGTAADSSKLGGKTLAEIMLALYPVGSIYMSVSATSPASLFGGTWEQLKDRFLLGAGGGYAAGGTGGAATVALEANQLPKITGYIEAGAGSSGSATSSGHGAFRSASGIFTTSRQCHYSYSHGSDTWTSTDTDAWQQVNMSFGNNKAHNNMPPYLAVYMWKRVS